MWILFYCIAFSLSIWILFVLYQKWVRPIGFPPGPLVVPILGSLPFFGRNALLTFKNWRSKYGPIIGMRIGQMNVIILCDPGVMKEAYDQVSFSGTWRPIVIQQLQSCGENENIGLLSSDGKNWIEQRKFLFKNFRGIAGCSKNNSELLIQEDIKDVMEIIKKFSGQPMESNLGNLFKLAILNSRWHAVAGKRNKLSGSKFHEIANIINKAQESLPGAYTGFFYPRLAKLFSGIGIPGFRLNKTLACFRSLRMLIQGSIEEHKRNFQENNLKDYMDAYIQEINSTTDSNSSFYGETGVANMHVVCMNLFQAGTETTSAALEWAIYFLMKNSKAQKILQDEIDSVIGKDKVPCLNDRQFMPYTEALVLEIFRMASVVPLGFPHCAMENIEFHGYKIPKGILIFANFHAHHYDEKVWGDPENFRPERFLTQTQTIKKAHPLIFPFSVGKRICPGEMLARNILFLYITTIFQKFSVRKVPNSIEGKQSSGFVRFPPKAKYIFDERGN